MMYQCKNGKTIHIASERFIAMSDDDLEKLELYGQGMEISDPFYGSVIEEKNRERFIYPDGDDDIDLSVEEDNELSLPLGEFNLPEDVKPVSDDENNGKI